MYNINTSPSPESVTLDILVNSKPIKQFNHNGIVYVEGRSNSNYSIRVKNNNSQRILAVISVDGLSINDGKPASENSQGWVINGISEIVISGWLVNTDAAAKFQFAGKSNTYAEKSSNDTNNLGVIGCMVFKEKPIDNFYKLVPNYIKTPWNIPSWPNNGIGGDPYYPGEPYYNPIWCTSNLTGSGSPSDSGSIPVNSINCSYSNTAPFGSATGSVCRSASLGTASVSKGVEKEETLGSAFGAKTDFKSTTTTFDRDGLLRTFVIHYKSKKELEHIGIVFEKKKVVKPPVAPNPFPASYCQPFAGWR